MKTDSMTIDNKELNNVEATKEQTGQTSDTWQIYTKKTHIIGRTVSIDISNVSGSTVSHR